MPTTLQTYAIETDTASSCGSFMSTRERGSEALLPNFIPQDDGESTHRIANDDFRYKDWDQALRHDKAQDQWKWHKSDSETQMTQRNTNQTRISKMLQEQLRLQISPGENPPARPWTARRLRTSLGLLERKIPLSPDSPRFTWFPRSPLTLSDFEVSSQVQYTETRSSSPNMNGDAPLKPCMKKSMTAPSTPPDEVDVINEDLRGNHKLRRVKTVDFQTPVSTRRLSWSLPIERASNLQRQSDVQRKRSLPGPATKSTLADAALTHTDVHVVAIVPSWPNDEVSASQESDLPPTTPTMQIIESRSGTYEVIWDDIPAEDGQPCQHRRRSSASNIRQTVSTPSRIGLERVNSKLHEWPWTEEHPVGDRGVSDPFKPETVVFLGEGHQSCARYDCAVDNDDLFIVAPPNSERPSARSSHHPSRPASIKGLPESRYRLLIDTDSDTDTDTGPRSDMLVVPGRDGKARPGRLIGASRRGRKPPSIRRLSNLDESEMNFRGHRDSVTLARQRIFHKGGVSPELFLHRDSVSIAKKRMHERNHTVFSERDISRTKLSHRTASLRSQVNHH